MRAKKKLGSKRNTIAENRDTEGDAACLIAGASTDDSSGELPRLLFQDGQIYCDCTDQAVGFQRYARAFRLSNWRHAYARIFQISRISIVCGNIDEGRLNLMVEDYAASLARGVDSRLALQMLATDSCALKTSEAYLCEDAIDVSERLATISNKFHRTYATQLETDARCRNGAKTDITVNNTVAVNAGSLVQRAPNATAGSQGDGGQTPRLALTGGSQIPMPVLEPDGVDVATEPEALAIGVNAGKKIWRD